MTALEENGGSDGNSSVAELEVRVESLEETTVDHETRILTTESEVTGRLKIILNSEGRKRQKVTFIISQN